jgi:DNA-binding transcriptional MerR regulator
MGMRSRLDPGSGDVEKLFDTHELDRIERTHQEGLSSAAVVEMFASRGVKISEATFRKYVQLGLLPRSRRVGRTGKHTGSMGLYPASTVRRINAIKRMMAQNFTIEEIRQSFLRFRDDIEAVGRLLKGLWSEFERALGSTEFDERKRKKLKREVGEAKRVGEDLLGRVESLEREIISPLERAMKARAFSSGASEGAGDLL